MSSARMLLLVTLTLTALNTIILFSVFDLHGKPGVEATSWVVMLAFAGYAYERAREEGVLDVIREKFRGGEA